MEPQHSKPRLRTGRSRYFLTPMVTGVKGVKPIQKTWHVKSLDIMEEMSKILPEQCTSITPKKESTCQFQSLLPTSQIIIYNHYYISESESIFYSWKRYILQLDQGKSSRGSLAGEVYINMGMDQYLLIPFLGEWTSIYQLFWCSPGVQGFDTLPYHLMIKNISQ